MRGLLWAGLLAMGCAQTSTSAGASGAPTKATAPAVTEHAAPEPLSYKASMVAFDGDQLEGCMDVEMTPTPGHEDAAHQQADKITFAATMKSVRLSKPCAQQFADRPPLASCVVDRMGADGRLAMVLRFFNRRTAVDSDADMRSCFELRGEWNADPEAATRDNLRQLQQLAEGHTAHSK